VNIPRLWDPEAEGFRILVDETLIYIEETPNYIGNGKTNTSLNTSLEKAETFLDALGLLAAFAGYISSIDWGAAFTSLKDAVINAIMGGLKAAVMAILSCP